MGRTRMPRTAGFEGNGSQGREKFWFKIMLVILPGLMELDQ